MNIFKVLASGDGSIAEPNLSAFLGYLLNPKADHGLNSAFLEKFIEPFLQVNVASNPLKPLFSGIDDTVEREYVLDLSVNSRFNVEVVLEKALKRNQGIDVKSEAESEVHQPLVENNNSLRTGKTKEIVDIFIKITQRKMKGKEDITYLFSKEEPVALILVENKIKPFKDVIGQLLAQYELSLKHLPKNVMSTEEWSNWKNNICTVLVSPYIDKLDIKFEEFKTNKEKGNPNSIFLTWNNHIEGVKSIKRIALELLEENAAGVIAPIPLYTADTLRALINFIDNDFSSDADDQQRGGKQSKEFIEYDTLEEAIAHGGGDFSSMSPDMKEWIRQLNKKILSIEGVTPHYTKQRIAAEFKGRRNWNITFQNAGGYKIFYKRDTGPLNPDDKPSTPPGYVKNIIISDPQAMDVALQYLENVIKK